jgi:hypothetical protein
LVRRERRVSASSDARFVTERKEVRQVTSTVIRMRVVLVVALTALVGSAATIDAHAAQSRRAAASFLCPPVC